MRLRWRLHRRKPAGQLRSALQRRNQHLNINDRRTACAKLWRKWLPSVSLSVTSYGLCSIAARSSVLRRKKRKQSATVRLLM